MSLWRNWFESYVTDGGRVLDAGCGSGRDSKAFMKHGFSVVAFDASREMCKAASELIGQEVQQMKFQEIAFDAEFDGIWACASFLHVPYEELPDVMGKLHKALKPEGAIYVSFKYGDGKMTKGERTFSNFTENTVEKLLNEAGFEVKEDGVTGDVRESRGDEKWVNVIAIKEVRAKGMTVDKELVRKAYKKLKSSVYYDKTQLVLRNELVKFEMSKNAKQLDRLFDQMFVSLSDDDDFDEYVTSIVDSIGVSSFPKKLKVEDGSIIINSVSEKVYISELQHYINMPVEGHVLGVLWIMLMGYKLDQLVYEHSYGNRIRKNLCNEFTEEATYSPYLFEPYFEQYESWRDTAMSEAEKHMSQKQDVVIITLDFKRFYYSLDLDDSVFESIYNTVVDDEEDVDKKEVLRRLNRFVLRVIEKYASLFGETYCKRRILPIGFLPSNILGNWCLSKLDKAVVDGWNPVYYGRYVDDILVVDKVEKNSEIAKRVKQGNLSKEEVIQFFLTSCSKWNGLSVDKCEKASLYALFNLTEGEYRLNPRYNIVDGNKSLISVKDEKVKIFYFKWDESDALITCFKENISKNKSEFRHLPEDEAVFQKDDYSDIYELESNETINKFRGINGVSLDKYKLSKFLGKYLRIGGMIRDKVESRFEKDIIKIFNKRAIIENYSAWEKILEILVINERFEAVKRFVGCVDQAIQSIELQLIDGEYSDANVTDALYIQLYASLCKCFALVWKEGRYSIQKELYPNIGGGREDYTDYMALIIGYVKTYMVDKSVMPFPIDMVNMDAVFSGEREVNLTRFDEVLEYSKDSWENAGYKYYPYLVSMYDFNMITCLEQLNKSEAPFSNFDSIHEEENRKYIEVNYQTKEGKYKEHKYYDLVKVQRLFDERLDGIYGVRVGDGKKNTLRIAIANVRINLTNFEKIVKDAPDRRYSRYKDISQLINQAIDQKVDMLIMPEAYVPFEWLSTIARTCAKNRMAIVTGVEHIKKGTKIFNYTAVILPYSEETHKCAYISFHLKKHYAPSEIEKIEGYGLIPVKGDNYELYKWNDCYFPVYCCYELTSISDRSIFQSYADALVAVEWNKDVKYYSNILESLSRDIHCYCIQVNSSEYGDSRITKPSKSEEKDVLRTKGGMNSGILVEDIDIGDLREFQLKEYSLQQKDGRYKSTPPTLNKGIIKKKIKGENLFQD